MARHPFWERKIVGSNPTILNLFLLLWRNGRRSRLKICFLWVRVPSKVIYLKGLNSIIGKCIRLQIWVWWFNSTFSLLNKLICERVINSIGRVSCLHQEGWRFESAVTLFFYTISYVYWTLTFFYKS